MKKVSIFALIALGGLTVGMTSCKKEDPATKLEINLEQTATIKGKVLINANEYDSVAKWSAPTSLDIKATVAYNELNNNVWNNNQYVVKDINYNAATGEYTIVAPVSANGTSVYVQIKDFKGKVIVPNVNDTINPSKTINVIWYGNDFSTPNLLPGETFNVPTLELNGNYSEDVNAGDEI